MNFKVFLDWLLVIALFILSKINNWRVNFFKLESNELLTFLHEPHHFPAARFGDEIKLFCQTLEEDTRISWYHNGVRVNPGRHHLPNSLVKVEVDNRTSILVIRKLTPDLQGRYHCKASNKKAVVRKGAWVNGTSEICSNGKQKAKAKTFTKKSGDLFSVKKKTKGKTKFIWTKSTSANPYKLTFFNEEMRNGNTSSHVNVSQTGALSVAPLDILDQGDWTFMLVKPGGCVKQNKYRLEIENSEADVCGRSDSYKKQVDDENVNTDAGSIDAIVGGKDAKNGSAPWYVGLCRRGKPIVYCGGTLVGKRWVITAAHCLYKRKELIKKDDMWIKLGSHSPDCNKDEKYFIKSLILHPKENILEGGFNNDIAIIELDVSKGGSIYSDSVKPACLEKSSFYSEQDVYKPKSLGRIVGLGILKEYDKDGAKTLQAVDVPIVAQDICKAATTYPIVENTTICAGVPEGGQDACHGDSGGPFTMEIQERTFLVGVISWGIGCARPEKYGYYVDVGKYYNWIHEHMSGDGVPVTTPPTSPTTDNEKIKDGDKNYEYGDENYEYGDENYEYGGESYEYGNM